MTQTLPTKKRISWIDTTKAIGIFCIYLGHFPYDAGNSYLYVFQFHVALFFFLSGCSEKLSSEKTWLEYFKRTVKKILIPFFIFSLVSLVVHCIYYNSYLDLFRSLGILLKGNIRNQFLAGGLWFLSCIFSVKIIFRTLKLITKHDFLLLALSFVLFVISIKVLDPTPLASPHWPYNVDSALFYIIFYSLGYCFVHPTNNLLSCKKPICRIFALVIAFCSLVYSSYLFYSIDLLNKFNINSVTEMLFLIIRPMILIYLVIYLSAFIGDIKLLQDLGQNTLYLCGSEYFIKLFASTLLETIGLKLTISTPLGAYLYSFILLVICNYTIVPAFKTIFKNNNLA